MSKSFFASRVVRCASGASQISILASLFVASAATAGSGFSDDFETSGIGIFPSGNWEDIADFTANPALDSGRVIQTTGRNGAPTNAFQIDQRRTTSQGLIRSIDRRQTHQLSADLRIDAHPTPVRGGNWTGGMGFFNQTNFGVDINQQAQAVIYSQNEQWFFYGSNTPSDFQITSLGAAANAGEWYNISMAVDAVLGNFGITITDEAGNSVVDQTVSFTNFDPNAGAFNRIAFFDGEYDPRSAEPGQFTVDNVAYIPAPAAAGLIVSGLLATTRRRRNPASNP